MGDICGVCVCVGKFGSAPAAGGTGAGSLKASEKASGVCRSGERGDSSLNRRGAAVFFYSSHLSGFIIVFFRCSQFLTARRNPGKSSQETYSITKSRTARKPRTQDQERSRKTKVEGSLSVYFLYTYLGKPTVGQLH